MKRTFRYVSLAASVFVFGAAVHVAAAAQDWEPAMPLVKTSGGDVTVKRGKSVFDSNCVECHGFYGKGDGPKMFSWPEDQYLGPLNDHEFIMDRGKEIPESIREGRRSQDPPFVGMPAYRYILSEEDMKSVIAYIQTLGMAASGMEKGN